MKMSGKSAMHNPYNATSNATMVPTYRVGMLVINFVRAFLSWLHTDHGASPKSFSCKLSQPRVFSELRGKYHTSAGKCILGARWSTCIGIDE